MAIRWNEAKYGDYQAKYDFLEYFMCNGPELDADTILHYRAKSFNDPVIMEIAYSYFSSPEAQREIRDKRKNKIKANLTFGHPYYSYLCHLFISTNYGIYHHPYTYLFERNFLHVRDSRHIGTKK